jgi:4-hydroxy-4-methyl-2-oxoglutarate aldolase
VMKFARENGIERFLGFDPATLYEAAGRRGMVDPSIRPAWAGAKVCGPALTVECPPGDNLMLHQAVAVATPGVVIVAKLGGYLLTGAWGEILTVAAKARGVAGLVVDGAVRDTEAIAEQDFPVFSRGLAIGSCTKERLGNLNVPMLFGGVNVRPGDIVIGNADGVVILEQERADEIYQASVKRRQRETQLIADLRSGKTTLDLLGLPGLRDETEIAPK